MADISLLVGGDLDLSPSGDLLGVDGAALTQQRVLRRLLTNPGAYIWHIGYGAGLARFVGQAMDTARITGVIKRQMLFERAIGLSPPPTVEVSGTQVGYVTANVSYADADGTSQTLAVPL